MNTDDLVPDRLRLRSRNIGDNEIAWCGSDIKAVLAVLSDAGAIVLGVESVVVAWDSSPQVEAISDASREIAMWLESKPRIEVVRLSVERAIADIERNVPNPYGDDVWY